MGAEEYLSEGWQEFHEASMPTMPPGDPWKSIDWLLQIESSLRTANGQNMDNANVDDPSSTNTGAIMPKFYAYSV